MHYFYINFHKLHFSLQPLSWSFLSKKKRRKKLITEMESTVISIENCDQRNGTNSNTSKPKGKNFLSFSCLVFSFRGNKWNLPTRNVIHSIKVGVALVLVSLLYLLDPLFKQVGENAMWAIMTVIVVFEFYAGFTILLPTCSVSCF